MIPATFLLLSIPIAVETRSDYVRIVHKKQTDNHKSDMLPRAILIIACGALDMFSVTQSFSWLQLLQSIILGIAWFWLVFDYLLNKFIGRNTFYLGNSSAMDRKLREWPWILVLFAKLWAFIAAVMFYYHLDLIIR